MEHTIMKKKEQWQTAFGAFLCGRLTIDVHILHNDVFCFQSDHVQGIENPYQHTLAPIQPDDGSILFWITPVFINKKKVKQNECPKRRVPQNFLQWQHTCENKKGRAYCPTF